MLYEIALQATFAVCLWILLDLLGARGPLSRRLPLMAMAASLAGWVLGEMLQAVASGPSQILLGRRVVYLGVSLLPLTWLWAGAAISRAAWYGARPWLIPLAGIPLLAGYSFLYWDRSGLFVSWTAPVPPPRGIVFWVFAGYAWTLGVAGTLHFVAAARRTGRTRPLRVAGLVLGMSTLVAFNIFYLFGDVSGLDPTPILLGVGALAVRLTVIDSGFAAVLPMGRRSIMEQLRVGVLLADGEGVVIDANPAARQLLGGRPLLGESLAALLERARQDPDRVLEVDQVTLRGGLGEVGFAALLNARTESAQLEHQVQEAQRLESLGILAGGVAHDFNNLLTGIMGNAGEARVSLDPEHPAHRPLRDLMQGARLASHLTGQLLAYAGKGSSHAQPVDLSTELHEMEALLESAIPKSVQLQLDLSEELPAVQADPAELRRVFMNLILNAAEAGDGAGWVRVETRAVEVGAEELAALVPGSSLESGAGVLLRVCDDGRGMDATTRDRIFDPFFTTKESGHGLGLAATLGIVHRCGGGIAVDSRPGAGTAVRVFLPASEEKAEAAAPSQECLDGSETVLVVDDEEYVRATVSAALSRRGYRVLEAASGAEALTRAGAALDLVLLDASMPGMSGEETFRALREAHPQLPVVLTTGYDQADVSSRYGEGLAGYLPKPFDPDELARAVRRALEGTPRGSAP